MANGEDKTLTDQAVKYHLARRDHHGTLEPDRREKYRTSLTALYSDPTVIGSEKYRNGVLNAVLNLISGRTVEIDGDVLEIKTYLTGDYDPATLPWINISPLEPAVNQIANFDTVSPAGEQFETTFRWKIELIGT